MQLIESTLKTFDKWLENLHLINDLQAGLMSPYYKISYIAYGKCLEQ